MDRACLTRNTIRPTNDAVQRTLTIRIQWFSILVQRISKCLREPVQHWRKVKMQGRIIDHTENSSRFGVVTKTRVAIFSFIAILFACGGTIVYLNYLPVSATAFRSRLDQVTRVRVAYYNNQAITVVDKKSIGELVGIFARVRERQSEPPLADAMALNFIFEGPGFQYWCYLRQDGYLFIRKPRSVLYLCIGDDLNRWLREHGMFPFP